MASGKTVVLPCGDPIEEDRVVGSTGTDPTDRLLVEVSGENVWLERRDLCDEDGELIKWEAYQPLTTETILARVKELPVGDPEDYLDELRATLTVNNIELGQSWECPTSPTSHCIYNRDDDPCCDSCVCCGHPEERK